MGNRHRVEVTCSRSPGSVVLTPTLGEGEAPGPPSLLQLDSLPSEFIHFRVEDSPEAMTPRSTSLTRDLCADCPPDTSTPASNEGFEHKCAEQNSGHAPAPPSTMSGTALFLARAPNSHDTSLPLAFHIHLQTPKLSLKSDHLSPCPLPKAPSPFTCTAAAASSPLQSIPHTAARVSLFKCEWDPIIPLPWHLPS